MLKRALLGLCGLLAGCGTVDQFSSRVSQINDNVATAGSDNVLRNILRAADNEPLTFVAVSKITGQRSADLKLGLPTVTLGKGQTTAQKQWVFTGNLLDNSLAYTLELSPLTTNTFTNGLIQPVDPGELESLSEQGIPRELLFYLLIDSITLDPMQGPVAGAGLAASGQRAAVQKDPAITYHNAPWMDDPQHCANFPLADLLQRQVDPRNAQPGDDYIPFAADGALKPPVCEFHAFQYLLMLAIEYGLRVDSGEPAPPADTARPPALPKPPAGTPVAAGSAEPPAAHARQRLCFDLSLANPLIGKRLVNGNQSEQDALCNAVGAKLEYFEINLKRINGNWPETHIHATIRLRSPYAVFHYLGQLTRLPPERQPQIQDAQWRYAGGDAALFAIERGGSGCFLAINRAGVNWCLPRSAEAGKTAVSVLTLLLQMNTNRSDLPTSAVEVGL